jgi:hypothetical protein
VPEVSVPVPIELPLLKKLTVPVAAVGETEAVRVTLLPAVTDDPDVVSVVVVAVPPPLEPPPGGCQKSPQPACTNISSEARSVEAITAAGRITFMCACLLLIRFLIRLVDSIPGSIGGWTRSTFLAAKNTRAASPSSIYRRPRP